MLERILQMDLGKASSGKGQVIKEEWGLAGWWEVGRASRYRERHLLRLGGGREAAKLNTDERIWMHTLEGNCMCNCISVLLPSLVCKYHWAQKLDLIYCFISHSAWQRALCREGASRMKVKPALQGHGRENSRIITT